MAKRALTYQTALLHIADPSKLNARIEYRKVDVPEGFSDASEKRELYSVTVYLEEEAS